MAARAPILDQILPAVRSELDRARGVCSEPELERRIADAPPVRPLGAALESPFGLIAEIKVRSPSMGAMREENVVSAPRAYESSPLVKAISVLTNGSHFGMSVQRLAAIRASVTKPVLRKDFIFDRYQVLEARAHGADAVLLMSQVLDAERIGTLQGLAQELGMDALVECHSAGDIDRVPAGTRVIGINSRSFSLGGLRYAWSKWLGRLGTRADATTDLSQFELIDRVRDGMLVVAESGIRPGTVAAVRERGFHAALVGTGLLMDPGGVEASLGRFEAALGPTA